VGRSPARARWDDHGLEGPRLAETAQAIDREAGRLEEWIGTANVRSSFPTPLESELKA
jgi:hypothetical protein